MSTEYLPYAYLIGWSKLNKWYYGIEYSNHKKRCAHPKNLWSIYFTSSTFVTQFREENGEPDVINIRKTFLTAKQAIAWEVRVLQKLNVAKQEKFLNRHNGGHNFGDDKIGIKNPMFGRTHTPEAIEKMKLARIGKVPTEETKIKLSVAGKNRIQTPATRKKISERNKGKHFSEETKEKLRKAHLGKIITDETRQKMRESHKGKHCGPLNSMFGIKWSTEQKEAHSLRLKKNLQTHMKGKVVCVDVIGNIIHLDKQEFDNRPNVVGIQNKIGKRRIQMKKYGEMLNELRDDIYNANVQKGWWNDLYTNEPLDRNFGEMLMLVVTELAEAMEGRRKNLMDDHLPHRSMVECELADSIIRLMDLAGGFGYDVGGALVEKLEYNRNRQDHSIEARKGPNGKKI